MPSRISHESLCHHLDDVASMAIAVRVVAWFAGIVIVGLGFLLAKQLGNQTWLMGAVGASALVAVVLRMIGEALFGIQSDLNAKIERAVDWRGF